MRIESIGLEHHGDVAVLGRHFVDNPVSNFDLPRGDLLQPGQHAQGSRLPAARGPDENQEFFVINLQVQIVHCLDIAVFFCNVIVRYASHIGLLFV